MNTDPEFLIALGKAQEKYAHVCPDMARQVIEMVKRVLNENRTNGVSEEYGVALRKALNRRDIIVNRDAYKALVGFYFGRRGNRVARTKSSRVQLPKRHQPEFVTEENGQITVVL
jgi:hypothetical protein